MLLLRKPTAIVIDRFLADQAKLDLTYSAVGQTFGELPARYRVDQTRICLGRGESTFEAAKSALRRWDQFRLSWLEAGPSQTPIEVGQHVVILARAAGLWWLNACRIVSVLDEVASVSRFGFAYGTLPDHAGSGEERFLIEWDHTDDLVWYDILAFSRPRHFLAKIGYPLVRITQKQFGRDSAAAMRRAVEMQNRSPEWTAATHPEG